MAAKDKILSKLLNGIDKSKLIVIQESLECRGHSLFQSFLKSWSCVHGSINYLVLLQERSANFKVQNVSIINVLEQFSNVSNEQSYVPELMKHLDLLPSGGKLFIDSIDPIVIGEPISELKKLLNYCAHKFDSIVTVINGVLTNEVTMHELKRLSTTWIEISVTKNYANKFTNESIQSKITYKKKHRRVDFILEFYDESFSIDTNYNIISTNQNSTNLLLTNPSGDINTTFNLNLKEEEREAKESLVLPYIKNNKIDTSRPQSGSSKVYYYPDENDDVDEDDPDDDLGF